MSGAGFLLFAGSVLFIDAAQAYPSWRALLPSTAAALLLLSGTAGGLVNLYLLESRPMIWLGDISYSWYLWHWPVLLMVGASAGGDDVAAALYETASRY